jgi:hypothetical protein
VLKPGDQGFDGSVINISYFAPAYYRAFGRVTGQTANWNNVAKTSYDVIEKTLTTQNGNASNGLVPAWSTPAGVPMSPPAPACRSTTSSTRAARRSGSRSTTAGTRSRARSPTCRRSPASTRRRRANIVDGYDLNGTPHPQFVTTGGPRAASFNGAAAAAAWRPGRATRPCATKATPASPTLMQLAGSTYYQESWTGLTLQFMTGLVPVPK